MKSIIFMFINKGTNVRCSYGARMPSAILGISHQSKKNIAAIQPILIRLQSQLVSGFKHSHLDVLSFNHKVISPHLLHLRTGVLVKSLMGIVGKRLHSTQVQVGGCSPRNHALSSLLIHYPIGGDASNNRIGYAQDYLFGSLSTSLLIASASRQNARAYKNSVIKSLFLLDGKTHPIRGIPTMEIIPC
jgi:hypothetical protein